MRIIDEIRKYYYRIQYKIMLRREGKDMVYPLEHRVHLRKKTFVIVDCEFGCRRSRLLTIIRAYLSSKIYERERIPLIIVYRENSPYANKMIKPILKRFEELRLKIWFYESPSVPFEMSVMSRQALLYINANDNWRELPSVDEIMNNDDTRICMFNNDIHWQWMFPNMVTCNNYFEFLTLFKSLV